ncbi:hypothetical protein ACVWWN_006615 [Mycobacterium sp. URHB0021]|jgi:hypothetical protein
MSRRTESAQSAGVIGAATAAGWRALFSGADLFHTLEPSRSARAVSTHNLAQREPWLGKVSVDENDLYRVSMDKGPV